MLTTSIRGGKAFAAEQKIRELKNKNCKNKRSRTKNQPCQNNRTVNT